MGSLFPPPLSPSSVTSYTVHLRVPGSPSRARMGREDPIMRIPLLAKATQALQKRLHLQCLLCTSRSHFASQCFWLHVGLMEGWNLRESHRRVAANMRLAILTAGSKYSIMSMRTWLHIHSGYYNCGLLCCRWRHCFNYWFDWRLDSSQLFQRFRLVTRRFTTFFSQSSFTFVLFLCYFLQRVSCC
jgi:hypothetical protein